MLVCMQETEVQRSLNLNGWKMSLVREKLPFFYSDFIPILLLETISKKLMRKKKKPKMKKKNSTTSVRNPHPHGLLARNNIAMS